MRPDAAGVIALVAMAALAGCGLKGPLTMPPKPGEVTVRPGPTAKPETPASGEKETAPATPPPPADGTPHG